MHYLLVASTGGHLDQLRQLAAQIMLPGDRATWATFDTPHSRTVLRDQSVRFVRHVAPRDARGAASVLPHAVRLLRELRPDVVCSTGAAVAVPFLGIARSLRIACLYIESAARADGPSLTGRIVSAIPGVQCCTQYRSWSSTKWTYRSSLCDRYEAVPTADGASVQKLVVTLGTITGFAFDRAVRQVEAIVPAGVEVYYQVGPATSLPTSGTAQRLVANDELRARIDGADAVIAHAGVGSVMSVLDAGKQPVLLPRRQSWGEHVDDHQLQLARELEARSLVLTRDASELTWDDVLRSTRTAIRRTG